MSVIASHLRSAAMPPRAVEYWLNPLAQMMQSPAWEAGLEKKQCVPTFETDTFRASLDRDAQMHVALLEQSGLLKQP
jgi:hypothetical protein